MEKRLEIVFIAAGRDGFHDLIEIQVPEKVRFLSRFLSPVRPLEQDAVEASRPLRALFRGDARGGGDCGVVHRLSTQ